MARQAAKRPPQPRKRPSRPRGSAKGAAPADPLPNSRGAIAPAEGAITYERFIELARDPNVPDTVLRDYLSIDRAASRPFRPAVHLDPTLVRKADGTEVRTEGAMDWANGFSRWRRQDRFRHRMKTGSKLPVMVSEGNSWFQFPLFLEDVIDQLGDKYCIWSVDAAGDTLDNMVSRFPEYLTALKDYEGKAKAFLFSGGGNDLVGEDRDGRSILEKVVNMYKKGKDARWHVETAEYRKTLNTIEGYYREVLRRVAESQSGLPVLIHGYDYAIPGPAPNEWRKPAWAGVDQWLGRALRARNIVDHPLQRGIIKLMIDDLNEMQMRLCGNGAAGADKFKNAYHVDIRGTLKDREWADELHPTDAGFVKVGARFRTVLAKLGL